MSKRKNQSKLRMLDMTIKAMQLYRASMMHNESLKRQMREMAKHAEIDINHLKKQFEAESKVAYTLRMEDGANTLKLARANKILTTVLANLDSGKSINPKTDLHNLINEFLNSKG